MNEEKSPNNHPKEENSNGEEDKDPHTLLSLLQSWDVETYLEQQPEEDKACQYFKATGSCPYQEVGCMFIHEETDRVEEDGDNEEEEEEKKEAETRLRQRERLSARSRSRRLNEERIRRLRDLSISCS